MGLEKAKENKKATNNSHATNTTKADTNTKDSHNTSTNTTTEIKPSDKTAMDEEDLEEMNRFKRCCCCFRYQRAANIIGVIDILGLIGFIGMTIFIKTVSDNEGLSSSFSTLLIIMPIMGILLVSFPRALTYLCMCRASSVLKRRRQQYMTRAITTILMFILCLILLILLILLYKGNEVFTITANDATFLESNAMKWTIILLAITLVISTLLDLYMSLAIRTFYLNLANGLEVGPEEEQRLEKEEKLRR